VHEMKLIVTVSATGNRKRGSELFECYCELTTQNRIKEILLFAFYLQC